MSLKIAFLKLFQHLPGANKLIVQSAAPVHVFIVLDNLFQLFKG